MEAWRPLDKSSSQAWARTMDLTSFWSTVVSAAATTCALPFDFGDQGISIGPRLPLEAASANRIRSVRHCDCFDVFKNPVFGQLKLLNKRDLHKTFDFWRRDPRDGAGRMPSTTHCGADVEPIAHAVLAGKARPHAVALVVKELALEQGAAFGEFDLAFHGVGFEQFLNTVKCRAVNDRLMLSLEPFAGIMGFADIDAVLEEVGEGTIGERNAALKLRDFGIATLGHNLPAVEFTDELAERS